MKDAAASVRKSARTESVPACLSENPPSSGLQAAIACPLADEAGRVVAAIVNYYPGDIYNRYFIRVYILGRTRELEQQ
ncbi:hypothetical protein BRAS3809_410003 [Bradyrhizobium sp. STM 3809]|nr:hypothetical protein BRAS3809_410003 [Bradyrhizobium sp. STM 3809]